MYEDYTRQSLPSKKYRELLGSALCVFNSNNSFIIENILRINSETYNWYQLIDRVSGKLAEPIKMTITNKSDTNIADMFSDLVDKRNRIVHSFQVTFNNQQTLFTKDREHEQFHISDDYLLAFIKENESLSSLLHKFRGH